MTNHTPGPWVIGRDIIGYRTETGFKRHIVGILWDDEQGMADSHLIAAAPDLLAALTDLLCQMEFRDGTAQLETEHALAAIAKATGQSA